MLTSNRAAVLAGLTFLALAFFYSPFYAKVNPIPHTVIMILLLFAGVLCLLLAAGVIKRSEDKKV